MRIDLISIFPAYFEPLALSLIGKARAEGAVDLAIHDLRDWTTDNHRTVDDTPYGGGPGMVMLPEIWGRALDSVQAMSPHPPLLVIPTPSGRPFRQVDAATWSTVDHLVIACGRYEGIDSRVAQFYSESPEWLGVQEVSIGDYVLAGGEAAALVMVEAVVRLLPGVLGNPDSAPDDSFSRPDGLLEGSIFTKPPMWRDLRVPEPLLSGHHAEIASWRSTDALHRTERHRPDLLGTTEAAPPEGTTSPTGGN